MFLGITLAHPWLREEGNAPDIALDSVVLVRMKQFTPMNKLKKVAMKVFHFYNIF